MGFLIGQIIAFLAGAALIGLFIGWALFSGRRAAAPAPGVDADSLKKAEARAKEAVAERDALAGNLTERDGEIAQLRHQIAQAEQYRVESASRLDALRAQVITLQDHALAGDLVEGGASVELEAELREREAELQRLRLAFDELEQAGGGDAMLVAELRAQVAELRATLESGGDFPPPRGDDEERGRLLEQNAKLSEETLGLKAAYDAAERSLEEQDGAMDQLSQVLMKSQQENAAFKQELAQLRASLGIAAPAEPPVPAPAPPARAGWAPPPLPPTPNAATRQGAAARAVLEAAMAPPQLPPAPAAPPLASQHDDGAEEATRAMGDLSDDESEPPPPVVDAAPAPAAPATAAPATDDGPQDLKRIKGIGPAIEKRLNGLGVVTWAQIAALDEPGIETLAEEVKVSADKIRKDQWVEQAQTLQAGG